MTPIHHRNAGLPRLRDVLITVAIVAAIYGWVLW